MSPKKSVLLAFCSLLALLVTKQTYESVTKTVSEDMGKDANIPSYNDATKLGKKLEAPISAACQMAAPEIVSVESKKLRPN